MGIQAKAQTVANEENIKKTQVEQTAGGETMVVVFDVNEQEALQIGGRMACTAGRIGAHVTRMSRHESEGYLRIYLAD